MSTCVVVGLTKEGLPTPFRATLVDLWRFDLGGRGMMQADLLKGLVLLW